MADREDITAAQSVDDRTGLSRLFVLIVLVEALTITSLYFFGRYFS